MDAITESFLTNQLEEAQVLAGGSDLLRIGSVGSRQLVVAEFGCRGLVRRDGLVAEAEHFVVGFRFGGDYLRRVNPPEILTLISPEDIWHPNMGGPLTPNGICVGRIAVATPLVELIYRVYELITWQSYSTLEYDTLQSEACEWARSNAERFPVDPRPLRWRADGSSTGDGIFLHESRESPGLLDALEIVE